MAEQHIKHWTIGDARISRIVEIADPAGVDISLLLEGGTPELVKSYEWLRPHFATEDGKYIWWFQAFVVVSKGKRIMVDTCIGNDRKLSMPAVSNMQTSFYEDLTTAGHPPDKFDYVLCTHLHFDHVGWNTRLVNGKFVPTFPNARYLFGRTEWEAWQGLRGKEDFSHVNDSILPVIEAGQADFVASEHAITDEVRLEPTHGHTPGHVSVRISSRGKDAVITGDLMHHPVQIAEPRRNANFDMDKAAGGETRAAFVERYGKLGTTVIGSHFPEPTAGRIVRDTHNWKFET